MSGRRRAGQRRCRVSPTFHMPGMTLQEGRTVPEETEKLRQDMEALGASIQASWKEVARCPLGPGERWEIERYVETSSNDLARLLRRLKKGRAGQV